jgi:hypothetical protein
MGFLSVTDAAQQFVRKQSSEEAHAPIHQQQGDDANVNPAPGPVANGIFTAEQVASMLNSMSMFFFWLLRVLSFNEWTCGVE